jgi:hypothetical protein
MMWQSLMGSEELDLLQASNDFILMALTRRHSFVTDTNFCNEIHGGLRQWRS